MRAVLAGWLGLEVVASVSLGAQGTDSSAVLRGRVIDARTATPLRDVGVVLIVGRDTVARTRSDSSGAFQTLVSAKSVTAHFTRAGYRADSLTAAVGGEFPLRVAMTPLNTVATSLGAVVVRDSVARSSFERRARRGSGGAYIRAEDIEKKKPARTSDLFRSYPGVRLDDSSGVTQVVSLRSLRQGSATTSDPAAGVEGRMPTSDARKCTLRVATDGRLMPPDFSVDDIRPQEIMGIELYLGAATIPAEFSSVQQDAPCGVIMIWLKKGPSR